MPVVLGAAVVVGVDVVVVVAKVLDGALVVAVQSATVVHVSLPASPPTSVHAWQFVVHELVAIVTGLVTEVVGSTV